jgi:threonine dehydrogenase-like Zn-dependent dehydrogenase
MGHETVGHISSLGAGVLGLTEGDLVTINPVMACGACENCHAGAEQSCAQLRVFGVVPDHDAAFAEFATVPSQNIVPLPALKQPLLGALIEPLAVGYHAARIAGIASDSVVLVIGGGPIGQAAALAARRLGAGQVLVSEISPTRTELLDSLGFTCVHPDALSAHLENGGSKPTVVIDAVGSSETFGTALTQSTTRARVVLVGMAEPMLTIPAYRVSVDERTIIGSFCYSYADFRETAEWVADHPDLVSPLIDQAVPLSEGPRIFEQLGHHALEAHKILLVP